ncbi:Uncharacterized protein DAT39_007618 [Clarias magur]|uniref:Uncharacterized protein n=1 Tax=Clarias magur TaxID=1594786 RepID=A0A8J4UBH4_CLAMG|nr:Uncharacterized protein DAT39_007618 [Clarias magur]
MLSALPLPHSPLEVGLHLDGGFRHIPDASIGLFICVQTARKLAEVPCATCTLHTCGQRDLYL